MKLTRPGHRATINPLVSHTPFTPKAIENRKRRLRAAMERNDG